ncbi:envelope glycoprotein K [Leporid alphaherpesvirus 4]|uniref:Envelope glycoprotein K n=1 Tax=Leporid alphaherpesvirus 4 TaxID=481315 RepID=J9QYQ4_9ALPH|nr:envelope glycoprotein K [Leporid alphaherpesvirus 4]AFR32498.1 envelope glycoprotein K [Leporid alphaherpesvirus 4]
MIYVQSGKHITTIALMVTYTATLGWYIILGSDPLHRCVYAVTPASAPNGSATKEWVRNNKSMVFIARNAHGKPRGGHSDVCYAMLMSSDSVSGPDVEEMSGPRLMHVHDAVNCLEQLWHTQMLLILAGAFAYVASSALYQRRCMFGVVSPAHKMVAPATYLLNYASRIVSSVALKYPYTKIARLLCELSVRRRSLVMLFEADPITFLYHRPSIGVALCEELLLRLAAQGMIFGTALIARGECSKAYPPFLTIVTWCFVVAIALSETYAMLVHAPKPQADPAPGRRSSAYRICSRCCSTILAGLAVRLCYIFVVVSIVIIALQYERKIQQRIFET